MECVADRNGDLVYKDDWVLIHMQRSEEFEKLFGRTNERIPFIAQVIDFYSNDDVSHGGGVMVDSDSDPNRYRYSFLDIGTEGKTQYHSSHIIKITKEEAMMFKMSN